MWIVTGVKTKKELKEKVKYGALASVYLENPSFFEVGFVGSLDRLVKDVEAGVTEIPDYGVAVTNHPKRSWYATIKIAGDGTVKVS
jgi:hypothetical protein